MDKKLRRNFLICVPVFLAVFAALLTVASLYDLQISEFLTKGSLKKGEYYSDNGFAMFFEVFGGTMVYIAGTAASFILLNAALNMREGEKFFFVKELKGGLYKAVKMILCAGFLIFGVYEAYCVVHDPIKYTDRYLQDALAGSGVSFTLGSGYLIAVQVVFALIISAFTVAALRRVKRENILKLAYIAVIILIVEAAYLVLVDTIKAPIGRMRFRTMNVWGDFSYYTPWYVINGARNATTSGMVIPSGGTPSLSILVGAASDTCRSFPSGHTYCAAFSFALALLPDLFDKLKKNWIKAILWAVPAVYTVTVAVCRIVVGAHFLSDVLVGGTLSFAMFMIAREVLILKFAHFKAFKRQPSVSEDTPQEE